ncbi:hypothetical protein Tco_0639436 [Tanacetum coccineum]
MDKTSRQDRNKICRWIDDSGVPVLASQIPESLVIQYNLLVNQSSLTAQLRSQAIVETSNGRSYELNDVLQTTLKYFSSAVRHPIAVSDHPVGPESNSEDPILDSAKCSSINSITMLSESLKGFARLPTYQVSRSYTEQVKCRSQSIGSGKSSASSGLQDTSNSNINL